jgi:hypothetical protein
MVEDVNLTRIPIDPFADHSDERSTLTTVSRDSCARLG